MILDQRIKVLILESDKKVREELERMIRDQGYVPFPVSNERECISMYRNHQNEIYAVLSSKDLEVGGELIEDAGLRVIRKIRENSGYNVLTILYSGQERDQKIDELVCDENALFFSKTPTYQDLTSLLQT